MGLNALGGTVGQPDAATRQGASGTAASGSLGRRRHQGGQTRAGECGGVESPPKPDDGLTPTGVQSLSLALSHSFGELIERCVDKSGIKLLQT